jgi:hypothetical protein
MRAGCGADDTAGMPGRDNRYEYRQVLKNGVFSDSGNRTWLYGRSNIQPYALDFRYGCSVRRYRQIGLNCVLQMDGGRGSGRGHDNGEMNR